MRMFFIQKQEYISNRKSLWFLITYDLRLSRIPSCHKVFVSVLGLILFTGLQLVAQNQSRERILINDGWKFYKYNSIQHADNLIYDVRREVKDNQDSRAADAKPIEAVKVTGNKTILKPWILPTGNSFIKDASKRYVRPEGGDFLLFIKTLMIQRVFLWQVAVSCDWDTTA